MTSQLVDHALFHQSTGALPQLPGAGAPVAGLIVAFGDFTTLAMPALGGVLMLASLRLGRTVIDPVSAR